MSLIKKVAFNTLAQISGKLTSTVLGLFSLALIARYLGPESFGEYTTILAFLGFFAVFADFGLTLITVQFISDKRRDENKVLNNIFTLRLVSILFILLLAPVIAIFFPYSQSIKIGLIIALASFVFPALNQVIVGLLQKKLSMERDAISENISRVVLLLGIIIVKKIDTGLNGVLLVISISAFINFLSHYILALKFAVIKLAWDFSLWKEIFYKSWPLALTIVLNLVYLRADTLILSIFKSSEEVGFYGMPYKIIDVLATIPFMFAGLILPIITAAWLENKKDYFKKILQKSVDFMIIMAVPIVIGLQFVSKEIIVLIAGPEFVPSGLILQILIFSVAAVFIGVMFSHAVIALDKQKKMIGFYAFTSLSSLIAYFILIPKYSYFGAAGVTIYSELMIAFFSAYCVFKYSGFRLNLINLLKTLGAGAIMTIFLLVINGYTGSKGFFDKETVTGLISIIILAGSIYSLSLYLLGVVKKEDVLIIFKKQKI